MVAMIRFACGTCNERLSVPAKFAGRKGACPSCHAVNRVPAADQAGAAAAPGRVERAATMSASSTASATMHAGANGSGATTAVEPRGHSWPAEPPAVRVTVRETVWRSVDPPTVERPPAAADSPAPPAARQAPAKKQAAPATPKPAGAAPPSTWADAESTAPAAAAPALPTAWPTDDAPPRPRRGLLGWLR